LWEENPPAKQANNPYTYNFCFFNTLLSLKHLHPTKKHHKYAKEEDLWKHSKYFTMQKYNLQNNPLKETKILQDIITLQLISSFNTSQNVTFQKSSYKNRHTM
jgi:hypothetical protein